MIKCVLKDDGNYQNGIEHAIKRQGMETIQFLFSFAETKKKYESNTELIWRCVYWAGYIRYYDKSVSSYLMKELSLDEDKLRDLQKFKYPKPAKNGDDVREESQYWTK